MIIFSDQERGNIKYLVFTKTTLKWPTECCDDGAAMAHNHFLFPDHWAWSYRGIEPTIYHPQR
jgi:hypothetical protein